VAPLIIKERRRILEAALCTLLAACDGVASALRRVDGSRAGTSPVGFLAALLWLSCSSTLAIADDVPFFEYRPLKNIGQIQIMTSYLERSPDMESRMPELEQNGIVALEAAASRVFAWKEQVGGHLVETTLSIEPPAGHGEGGASSRARLKIVMDGNTRMDCSVWYLDRVSIDPARKFITLIGHDGAVHFDGFESSKTVDDDWLVRRAESTRRLI